MDKSVEEIARGLSEAQRRYLRELEPNTAREGIPAHTAEIERGFRGRSHRKMVARPGLDTAWALGRKGLVKTRPEPVECGFHYASLTPLGQQVAAHLTSQTGESNAD